MKNKKIIFSGLIATSILVFYSFGFYHLAKFETVDEHFWKFERIPQYWDAIKTHNLKKTYINDKPGITVALISGVGLFFERHPEDLRIREKEKTKNDLLTIYNSEKTEDVNFSLRAPILLFNGLFFIFFFWIIRKITNSEWIAVFSVAFMAVSPVLIGISQILNPDSLLWVFSAASIFSYIAILKTGERKFIILTSFFTGLSLLSKYSANILFPFYFLIMFSEYFIYFDKYKKESRNYFLKNLLYLLIIFLGSLAIFSVFMPAVFFKIKYLYRGTIGAPGFSKIAIPLAFSMIFIAFDSLVIKNFLLKKIGFWLSKNRQIILKISSALIFLIFITVIFNVFTGQKIIPFDKLEEDIYRNGKEIFDGVLLDNPGPIKITKELLLEFYPFIFSQLPLLLAAIIIFWIKIIFKGTEKYQDYIFFCSIIPIVYFLALIFSNVLANIRYSVMLYPILSFLGGIATFEILEKTKERQKEAARFIAFFAIIVFGIFSLWQIKPFYFNFSNFLLPKEFLIADSWGYGEYEAASYLNRLPEPEKMLIWTDRSAICQFIKGSCIRDYKIDINKTKPDYFILSRRGVIRHQFLWKNPELAKNPAAYYYEKKPEWSIMIDGRPDNFVKIIKSEE